MIAAEHYGAMTGPEARAFLPRSIEAARQTRAFLEASYARTGNTSKTAEELIEYLEREAGGYFLPREVLSLVVSQMLRFIVKQAGDTGRSRPEP